MPIPPRECFCSECKRRIEGTIYTLTDNGKPIGDYCALCYYKLLKFLGRVSEPVRGALKDDTEC